MASIYDKASLVLIPSGTKTSKVYSQKPVNGDGDFTFSRSTAATRVNADGNIEKETQNLLTYSNTFSSWSPTRGTLVQGVSDPFGGNDAWSLTATDHDPYLYNQTAWSGVATLSIWAKGVGSSIGKPIQLRMGGSFEEFTLTGDWQRFEKFTNGSASNIGIEVPNPAVAGDVVHIYGAQLEYGLVARDYIETTTAAVEGGITDNVPRLDYTDSSCPALLLEPQRTNDLPHSEYIKSGVGGYTITTGSVTNNNATSPEGYTNAALFEMPFANAGFYNFTTGGSKSIGDKITLSMFAKIKSGSTTNIIKMGYGGVAVGGDRLSRFNISTGTITYSHPDADSVSIEDYGNGWYRLEQTQTCIAAGTAGAVMYSDGEADFYLWGVQSELGSYATSYIPTYGTSVTRNADTTDDLDTSSLLTQSNNNTFFGEVVNHRNTGNTRYIASYDSARNNSDRILIYTGNGSNNYTLHCQYKVSGETSIQFNVATNVDYGDTIKFAVVFNGTQMIGFANGVKTATATIVDADNFNKFDITDVANEGGVYKQLIAFPTALTDQEAIDLTTI